MVVGRNKWHCQPQKARTTLLLPIQAPVVHLNVQEKKARGIRSEREMGGCA